MLLTNDTRFDVENAEIGSAGDFSREGVCIHEEGVNALAPSFPAGDYCVYKMNDISCPSGFGFEVLVNSGGILLKSDQEPVIEQGNYIIFILFKKI